MHTSCRYTLGVIRKLVLVFLGFLVVEVAYPQEGVPLGDTSYHSFLRSRTAEFKAFGSRNDSAFLGFLRKAWVSYAVFRDEVAPRNKPRLQPRMDAFPFEDSAQVQPKGLLQPLQLDSLPGGGSGVDAGKALFEFFGWVSDLPVPDHSVVSEIRDQGGVERYYRNFSQDSLLRGTEAGLRDLAARLNLNDYGYFLLLDKAGRRFYPDLNRRLTFTWICMVRAGMDTRMGFSGDRAFLLLSCDYPLRSSGHVEVEGKRYTLFRLPGLDPPGALDICTGPLPVAVGPVGMILREFPAIPPLDTVKVFVFRGSVFRLKMNDRLERFLHHYAVTDLQYYFNTPLSPGVQEGLDRVLEPMLTGRNELEKVNLLLAFIQTTLEYMNDLGQFGREKYMFADEALFYPFCDCEDRAVLFARLVKRYTDLDVVGLDWPDHVAAAVRFTVPVQGDFISFRGDRYYICDPTYRGAGAGVAMKGLNGKEARIIRITR